MTILRRGMFVLPFLPVVLSAAPVSPTPAAVASGLSTRVTVEVRHAPLPQLLDRLSEQGKVNFIMTDKLDEERVTAFLHDVTIKEVLDTVKESKGIDYRQIGKGNTFLIAPKDSPQLRGDALVNPGPELDARVTVRLKQAPLDALFQQISKQTKANFVLDEALADRRVTMFLKNVTARDALEIALALKGLTCRPIGDKGAYRVDAAK